MDFLQILWDGAIYVSLVGFLLLIISLLTGLRILKPKPKLHLHKKLSITGAILIGTHALIMIYFYYFT